jgi:HD-GYP domain-containing protein (c-di-GMP phosphodiesterase class II)
METGASLQDHQVFPIPLATMQPGTLAPVDLYIRTQRPAGYVLYKGARAPLRNEIRERLLVHGVRTLYLRKKDESAYYDYVEENVSAIIKDDLLPVEQACEVVYKTSSRVMAKVFDEPRSGKTLKRAHSMVEATVLSVLKNPDALWHMLDMASHDYYTYTHCVNVSMFMVAASRDLLGIDDHRVLERIGLGGVFHDIGKSQIPESILSKPGRLTSEEFERIKAHPVLGLDLVKNDRKASATTAQIVRGHPEHCDGSGYPDGLADRSIGKVVRLATIVDVYDAMTTNRSYARAREPFHALKIMLTEMDTQFDKALLRAFVKFLGPRDMRQELRDASGVGSLPVPAETVPAG